MLLANNQGTEFIAKAKSFMQIKNNCGLNSCHEARQMGLLRFLNAYSGKKHIDGVYVGRNLKALMLGHEFRNVRVFLKVSYDTQYQRLF